MGKHKKRSYWGWILLVAAVIWFFIPDPIPVVDELGLLALGLWKLWQNIFGVKK